jgi:predicted PurR-regulated permease PerM
LTDQNAAPTLSPAEVDALCADEEVSRSPGEIHDPRLRREAQKAAIWIGMAALAALVVFFAQPLLVIFGGIVFAAMIDGGARLLGRVLPVGRGWRIVIVLVAAVLFLAWAVSFTGSQIARQAAAMPAIVELQVQRALTWAESHGITVDGTDFNGIARQLVTGVGPLTRAVGGVIGGLTTLFLIAVLGIYIAVEPRLYERGVAWMLPVDEREHWHETAARMGFALRRLLAGRLLGMVIEGVATGLALWAYGVPMAALLGLLTGLLAFLPNIGAPISGALMILVGFAGGTEMGLYCIAVYVVVQTVDSNIIIPMVAKKTVDLAPALVLGAQLVFGVMFGILGLALADPMVAMVKILLERRAERNTAAAVLANAGEPPPLPAASA